jgi:hypothetical protein
MRGLFTCFLHSLIVKGSVFSLCCYSSCRRSMLAASPSYMNSRHGSLPEPRWRPGPDSRRRLRKDWAEDRPRRRGNVYRTGSSFFRPRSSPLNTMRLRRGARLAVSAFLQRRERRSGHSPSVFRGRGNKITDRQNGIYPTSSSSITTSIKNK